MRKYILSIILIFLILIPWFAKSQTLADLQINIETPKPNTIILIDEILLIEGYLGKRDKNCDLHSSFNNKGFFSIKLFNNDKSQELIDFTTKNDEYYLLDYPKNLEKDRCGEIYLRESLGSEDIAVPGRYIIEVKSYSKEFQDLEIINIPIKLINYNDIGEDYCAKYWENEYHQKVYATTGRSLSHIDFCYSGLAGAKGDINICTKISDAPGRVKDQCYENLVHKYKQSCKNLLDSKYKIECRNAIGVAAFEGILETIKNQSESFFHKNTFGIAIQKIIPWLSVLFFIFYFTVFIIKHKNFKTLWYYFISGLLPIIVLIIIFQFRGISTILFIFSQQCDYGKSAFIQIMFFLILDFFLFCKGIKILKIKLESKHRFFTTLMWHLATIIISFIAVWILIGLALLASSDWCGT